jgi:hypothetical protein
MNTGETGNVTAAVTAKPAAGQRAETGLSERTRLEMAAGRRAAERRALQTAVPSAPKRTSGTANGMPFSLDEPVDTGLLEATANQPTDLAKDIQHEAPVLDFPPVQERVNAETPTSLPKFDRAVALEFYNAVGQSAFMLGLLRERAKLQRNSCRAPAADLGSHIGSPIPQAFLLASSQISTLYGRCCSADRWLLEVENRDRPVQNIKAP